ncbi:hypothetical protein WMY93_025432 [Mugilogobius chulae]|uniref:Nicotinate phosphoribosyltransferase n=1 Tax=Mugilogobius chulae TaxID=88201 RepID=A0AAW0NDH7_9GOBI
MERSVRERVPPLLTDLYQFTMAYAYWRAGRHQEPAVFELFFRDNPFGGGFSLFAGLQDCLQFLQSFRFKDEDVEFLLPEGTVVFARVPVMEVSGPLAVVQLLETSLLCLVNYASLVCSNAARFRLAAGSRRTLLEMGLRRAQGPDGGLTASRYSYIGGFDMTSNVQAGFLFGIPVVGTMAHSYITSFTSLQEVWPQTLKAANGENVELISRTKGLLSRVCVLLEAEPGKICEGELAAFLTYAIAYPHNFLPVIDSYSVSCSGLLNFCAVALALSELGYRPLGVRLDSGDLCKQSLEVRRVFRLCSQHFSVSTFNSLIIVGTNSFSENSMSELNKKENEIDAVGVGTHLVTCTKQPSLGCVYKLVEVRGRPRMKVSEEPEKSTVPGKKAVYRLLDTDGHPFLDVVYLAVEPPPKAGHPLSYYLREEDTSRCVTPAQVTCLWQEVFTKGQVIYPLCTAKETRAKAQSSLQTLDPKHKRLQDPDIYTVALSEKLYKLVSEIRKSSTSNGTNFLLSN